MNSGALLGEFIGMYIVAFALAYILHFITHKIRALRSKPAITYCIGGAFGLFCIFAGGIDKLRFIVALAVLATLYWRFSLEKQQQAK